MCPRTTGFQTAMSKVGWAWLGLEKSAMYYHLATVIQQSVLVIATWEHMKLAISNILLNYILFGREIREKSARTEKENEDRKRKALGPREKSVTTSAKERSRDEQGEIQDLTVLKRIKRAGQSDEK